MGFRRHGKEAKKWEDWLAAHRDELVRCGIADWLFSDQRRWGQFSDDWYDYETGWSPEMLSPEQLELFRSFVEREYGTEGYLPKKKSHN